MFMEKNKLKDNGDMKKKKNSSNIEYSNFNFQRKRRTSNYEISQASSLKNKSQLIEVELKSNVRLSNNKNINYNESNNNININDTNNSKNLILLRPIRSSLAKSDKNINSNQLSNNINCNEIFPINPERSNTNINMLREKLTIHSNASRYNKRRSVFRDEIIDKYYFFCFYLFSFMTCSNKKNIFFVFDKFRQSLLSEEHIYKSNLDLYMLIKHLKIENNEKKDINELYENLF